MFDESIDEIKIFTRSIQKNVSNFVFALDFWCDKKNIKRSTYLNFLKILKFLNISKIKNLFNRLTTLHDWCRKQLFFSVIHTAKVIVQNDKQSTETKKSSENKIHYLNVRVLINIILFVTTRSNFHTDMTEIVDSLSKYWHSNAWKSFMKTCFIDDVKYFDEILIFSSDFVQYFCNERDCENIHFTYCDQMTFFDRDKRFEFFIYEQILLRIRALMFNNMHIDFLPDIYIQTINEYLLIENFISEIVFDNIIVRRLNVALSKNQIFTIRFFVRHVFNMSKKILKLNDMMNFVRKKFELKIFDRQHMIDMLNEKIFFFWYSLMTLNYTKMYIISSSKFTSCRFHLTFSNDKKMLTREFWFWNFMKQISKMFLIVFKSVWKTWIMIADLISMMKKYLFERWCWRFWMICHSNKSSRIF